MADGGRLALERWQEDVAGCGGWARCCHTSPGRPAEGTDRRGEEGVEGPPRKVEGCEVSAFRPRHDPGEVIVEFKGDTIDFAGTAKGAVVGLDPATDPKCLDFKVPVGSGLLKKGSTYESVYRLDGDTLTWAVYHGRGRNRALTFDRPTEAGVMVMVLRRVKA